MSEKTAELEAFENIVQKHMASEIPNVAKNVRLRAVSADFITLLEESYSKYKVTCAEDGESNSK